MRLRIYIHSLKPVQPQHLNKDYMIKERLIVGLVLYDEDENLFYCKVGGNSGQRKLLFTVWGSTKWACEESAKELLEWLNGKV